MPHKFPKCPLGGSTTNAVEDYQAVQMFLVQLPRAVSLPQVITQSWTSPNNTDHHHVSDQIGSQDQEVSSRIDLKKLMGLCWILGLDSLPKMCFRIHKGGAHPELATDRANPRYGTVTGCAPRPSSWAALVTPGSKKQGQREVWLSKTGVLKWASERMSCKMTGSG